MLGCALVGSYGFLLANDEKPTATGATGEPAATNGKAVDETGLSAKAASPTSQTYMF